MTIKKVLIANRGEIAMRILRTLKKMGIKAVAVHSESDKDAMHVNFADESVCIGPAEAKNSYNNIKNIISAAVLTGCDAIHPGYGFLSENPEFSEITEEHNIKFLGPTSQQISQLGNKMTAKNIMQSVGINVIPGTTDTVSDSFLAEQIAQTMEFPILIKAVECGGGRGQRVVHDRKYVKEMFLQAQLEAVQISNNNQLYIEKYFASPKHIEFQIIGDGKGNVISLGTRDCSIQRKHQKVLEEAPANLDKKTEYDISYKICKVLSKLKYRSAGTVEFLEQNGKLYFIEMNTRVQVEHPVTESITGLDIIKMQIQIADDKPLPKQKHIVFSGHSIESRITAEDAFDFTPSPGKIENYTMPGGPDIRVDSAIYPNFVVPPWYDSMIAKIISKAPTREECIKIHEQALKETSITGIKTSTALHLWLIRQEEFEKRKISTQWMEKVLSTRKAETHTKHP